MNGSLSISDYIKEQAALIERELERSVPSEWSMPAALREAMLYSLMAGGKRLRPILVLAAAEALGGRGEDALPVALAVEMIHTYSLIHDDLPAMDNDDFRRGKPTNHKVFGEAMAILAGDALLTHAFYTVVQAARKRGVPGDTIADIVEELARLSGAPGMVGGQAADMQGEQGVTKLEELEYIHLHKTSDLIVFSLKAGGRIAGADSAQLAALERFGTCIGLAFQIQDDILDLVGDEVKLGKPVQSDVKQQKVTYPYFIGMDASQAKVEELTREARQAVIGAGFPAPERLLELADYLMKRDH
ncbi:geranylgeranyl diphosphate synthase, type II [Paenibacillus sp. UNCCL117]|uniref:polyprenyl synthetase family protein n=1 Tax=unclassified Paenibacillus TaxID=185978 RepID=UPI000891383E|nr:MULTISPECIES: farnesyl diphosphate synthase [unclassified Paenibacillus]SDD44520.1 farnesyl-diphosphate synthase [Paenibacillus sp. cl123]SFW47112.1 geranylgeranyl diphosphate synthase, type II [Paenibacillus sp. UNCCL117]